MGSRSSPVYHPMCLGQSITWKKIVYEREHYVVKKSKILDWRPPEEFQKACKAPSSNNSRFVIFLQVRWSRLIGTRKFTPWVILGTNFLSIFLPPHGALNFCRLLGIGGSWEGYVSKHQCFVLVFLFFSFLVLPLDTTMRMILLSPFIYLCHGICISRYSNII